MSPLHEGAGTLLGGTLGHYRITAALGAGSPPPLAAGFGMARATAWRVRLRRNAASARPRRNSASLGAERGRAVAKETTR
jgi:hypothetical protein